MTIQITGIMQIRNMNWLDGIEGDNMEMASVSVQELEIIFLWYKRMTQVADLV